MSSDSHPTQHRGLAGGGAGRTDDLIGPGCRLLLVGINPGLKSAERNLHFARPGNRFWPALHAAGITPRLLKPDEQSELIGLGVGITNLVARPSAAAAEVTTQELRAGALRLSALVRHTRPRVVAVLGISAYRTAFENKGAQLGLQPQPLAGAQLWVLPNPSGLNARAKPADHAAWLKSVAAAAQVPVRP